MSQKPNLSIVISIIVAVVLGIGGLGAGYYFYNKATKLTQNKDSVVTDISGTGSFASILFGKSSYELNYHELKDKVEVLSLFELGDPWQSSGYWDKRIFLQGEASLAINAANGVPELLTYAFDQPKDFAQASYISYYVNVSDFQVLEKHSLKFGDKNLTNYYAYSVTNLKNGWNYVRIPVKDMVAVITDTNFNLSQIETMQLEVISRPNNSLVANFDYIQIVGVDDFTKDWQGYDPNFIGLAKMAEEVVISATQNGSFQSTLTQIPGIKDGVIETKVSPQTRSSSAGLFFRGNYKNSKGYYFVTGGVDSNTWALKKFSQDGWVDLIKGEISNFNYEQSKFYWLRVVLNGNEIKLYFSINGEDFTELTTLTDDTYISGGVGLAVFNDYAFFDEVKVTK